MRLNLSEVCDQVLEDLAPGYSMSSQQRSVVISESAREKQEPILCPTHPGIDLQAPQ